MAKRWTEVRLEVMAIIAVVFMGLGFALGVYREPLQRSVGAALATVGIGSSRPDFETVNAVFQKGDYPAALRLAQPLADEGDARAQSIVAQIHYRGRGVPQSDTEAATWFRRAADQGDALAQFYLGVMYNEGRGVPQDYAEAAKWYRLAADQGDAQAQYNLGLSYARGEGVTPDPIAAHMWLNLAAARFPAADSRGRTAATRNRDNVAGEMTSDQLVEAQRRAREWKPKTPQGQCVGRLSAAKARRGGTRRGWSRVLTRRWRSHSRRSALATDELPERTGHHQRPHECERSEPRRMDGPN